MSDVDTGAPRLICAICKQPIKDKKDCFYTFWRGKMIPVHRSCGKKMGWVLLDGNKVELRMILEKKDDEIILRVEREGKIIFQCDLRYISWHEIKEVLVSLISETFGNGKKILLPVEEPEDC